MPSLINEFPVASCTEALAHFSSRLRFETDCSDVYHSQQAGEGGYLLVDVRSPASFAAGHIPGAINIPSRAMTAERLAAFSPDTLFVVYCAGPHCNGVHRAAVRLSGLGYAVKEMIGGVTGWLDEGLTLVGEDVPHNASKSAVSCSC